MSGVPACCRVLAALSGRALCWGMPDPSSLPHIFRCPHCKTEYRVTYTATLTRDSGSAYCKGCRKKMIEWNDYGQPSFTPVLDNLNEDRLPPPRAGRQRY
jgi:hypothetical protein